MEASVMRAMLKTVVATGAFAAIHSLLASRRAKRIAADALGQDRANGLYRVAYIAQSFATGGLLLAYLRHQPSIVIWDVRGPASGLMHIAQVAGLTHAVAAAHQVGVLRITGLENASAWFKGRPVLPMPEAQGPEFCEQSKNRASGPFALSRHPLNFSPLMILWLQPRMNSTLLAFNASATLYLWLGSLHEEQRLLKTAGSEYEAYRTSGVPFYWPVRTRNPAVTVNELSLDKAHRHAS